VLCNIMLITILISILSNEFADINANAQAEVNLWVYRLRSEEKADIQHLFQKVVKTVEGVKSDAIFSYLPPLNILAFVFLTPLSYVCSPRTLHTINVFCIRLTVCPLQPNPEMDKLMCRAFQSCLLYRFMSDINFEQKGLSDFNRLHQWIG